MEEQAGCVGSGESVLLYILGKNTVFFQLEKEQNFLPSVYTLWKYPEVLDLFCNSAFVKAGKFGLIDWLFVTCIVIFSYPGILIENLLSFAFRRL